MSKLPALELRRKLLHILSGGVLVAGLHFGFFNAWLLGGLLFLGGFLSFTARARRLPIVNWWLTKFERPGAWPGFGALTFTLGALLSWLLFPREIALAAIAILAVGDGVSALIGPFGRIRTRLSTVKLFEGTLAGALLGGLAATIFLPAIPAFLAALLAMLVEAVEVKLHRHFWDDNLTVPLTAGAVALLWQQFFA